MKPRTEAEIADYVRRSLEPLAGQVVARDRLVKHLAKVLDEVRDLRRPVLDVAVTDVHEDGTIVLALRLDDATSEQLADLFGRRCHRCMGHGTTMTKDCESERCDVCKGRGRVPF